MVTVNPGNVVDLLSEEFQSVRRSEISSLDREMKDQIMEIFRAPPQEITVDYCLEEDEEGLCVLNVSIFSKKWHYLFVCLI